MKIILHKVKMFEAKALSIIGVNTKTRRRRFAPLAQNIGLSVYFIKLLLAKFNFGKVKSIFET